MIEMTNKFITFKPLTDMFKETMELYQSMTDKDEMKGAADATERFIKEFKLDYRAIELSLEIDTGPFSVEKLIDELYNGFMIDQAYKMNLKNFIKRLWVLSPDYVYK